MTAAREGLIELSILGRERRRRAVLSSARVPDRADSTPPEPLPERLGRYRIERRLGKGGMAEVFVARSAGAEGVDKVLVVKRILPSFAKSDRFTAMFVDEAKVAMRLNHPNVVQVYAFEQTGDGFLLAMELVDGVDLGRLVSAARRRGRRLPHGLAAFIVQEVAKGLDYAHGRRDEHGEPLDIVHRDVSPQNVLLTYEGVVKVADFGIAKARLVTDDAGVIKGKLAYMSPEQARAEEVDRRSDVYALGVLFAELLMGRSMYPGQKGLELLERVRAGDVVPPSELDPSVPEELDAIVRRATAADRGERYPTARAMAAALAHYLRTSDVVYDAEALERFIADVTPREPDGAAGPDPSVTLAEGAAEESPSAEHRERRRVILLVGRVHGADAPAVGPLAAKVLADLAYKYDAVLGWYRSGGALRCRYTLGLGKASAHDPLRAMRLATDVLEALVAVAEDAEEWIEVAVGLSRGMVSAVRDERGRLLRQSHLGGVLDVAEALSDAGGPGEVMVSGEVYRLARRDFAFEEDEVEGPRKSAPGAPPRPLRAFRLVGPRSREERAEDAHPAGGDGSLIGRGAALATLAELYRQVVETGHTRFAGIVGELGAGKTALVGAFLSKLSPPPTIVRGDCVFGYAEVPYRLVGETVRDAVGLYGNVEGKDAARELSEFLADVLDAPEDRAQAMDALAPLVGPSQLASMAPDDEDRPMRVVRAVELVLGAMSRRAPVIVWVDGLQWADAASLGVLRSLLDRAYGVPCLFLMSMRPDERAESLLDGVPRIDVGELLPEEARRLVMQRLGGAEVPEDVVGGVVERAGGNPFFVLELVEALLERGAIELVAVDDGFRVVRRPEVPLSFPSTLEEVIAGRLDELPDEPCKALRWFAVSRSGLREEDLAALASPGILDALPELLERGLLVRRPGGALAFSSALVRHVSYESLEPEERVRMHRRLARHLSGLPYAPKARVAWHLELAGEREEAGAAWLEAGEAASRGASHEEALQSFERALSLLPDDPSRRFRAHAGRERVLRSLGRRTEQLVELAVMRSIAESARLDWARAVALGRLARFELDNKRRDGVRALLDQAIEAAKAAGDEAAEIDALRLAAELERNAGRLSEALVMADRALARCGTRPEVRAQRGLLLVLRGTLLRGAGRIDEAHESLAEAVVLFRRAGIDRLEAHALDALADAASADGSLEDAVKLLRASLAIERDVGHRLHLARKLAGLGQLYSTLGDAEESRRFFARALEVVDVFGDRASHVDTLLASAEARLDGDEPAAAARLLEAARERIHPVDPIELRARADLVAARLAELEGDFGRALYLARSIEESSLEAEVHRVERALVEASAAIERGDRVAARHAAASITPALAAIVGELRGDRLMASAARLFDALGDAAALEAASRLGRELVAKRHARLAGGTERARYAALAHVRRFRQEAPVV